METLPAVEAFPRGGHWMGKFLFLYFVILGKLYDNLNMQTNCVALSIKLLPFPVAPSWVISKVLAGWSGVFGTGQTVEPWASGSGFGYGSGYFLFIACNSYKARLLARMPGRPLAWATVRASHDWWNWQLRQHPHNRDMAAAARRA